jgi:branched-chain amino acid transport system substrate-binding protein
MNNRHVFIRCMFSTILLMLAIMWMATSVIAEDTISIGCVTPLSGGYAHYGTNTKRGMEMAFEEINGNGGLNVSGKNYQLKAEACDDEGKSDLATTCGRKLATMYRTPIIYTPASYSGFPLMGFNQKMNFIVMATSQSPPFTQKGNKLVIRWINSVERSMGPWVKFLIEQLDKNNLNVEKVGIMEINTEVGKNWAAAFVREWEKNKRQITSKEIFDANATDYYTQLTSLLAKNPDAIMMCGPPDEPASLIFKQARELGFKGIFICSVSVDGEKLMQYVKTEWLENTFLEAMAWALPSPSVDEFKAKYNEKYKDIPVFSAGLAYEGGIAIAKAVEKAQSLEPVKIWKAFPSILPVPECMFCGRDMDETGDVYFPMYLKHIKDGQLITIKE